MFPIGDDNQGRLTTPVVVYVIIAINLAVFLLFQQAGATAQGEHFTYGYSVIPLEVTTGTDLTEPMVVPDEPPIVDPRTGRRERPVIPEAPGPSPIYLTCGLVAAFAQIAADPNSVIPSLGASGAIAGVLGAYLIMFPRNRVRNIV